MILVDFEKICIYLILKHCHVAAHLSVFQCFCGPTVAQKMVLLVEETHFIQREPDIFKLSLHTDL